jgi:hypothetical protein
LYIRIHAIMSKIDVGERTLIYAGQTYGPGEVEVPEGEAADAINERLVYIDTLDEVRGAHAEKDPQMANVHNYVGPRVDMRQESVAASQTLVTSPNDLVGIDDDNTRSESIKQPDDAPSATTVADAGTSTGATTRSRSTSGSGSSDDDDK